MRLTMPGVKAIRIGLRPRIVESNVWVSTLEENGAMQDPGRPEEKVDRIFLPMLVIGLLVLALIIVVSVAGY